MIRLDEVVCRYDDHTALDGVSFSMKEGERVVLLGNNGCGKSTLLKILGGLLFADEGHYFYDGQEVTKRSMKSFEKRFRREVGILFQNPDTMLFNPTVYEEIAFGLREIESDEVGKRVRACADAFEISHLLDRSPLKLSGGEKQKVAFAAIFVLRPKLLLLDEPTANMDPRSTGWLVDFLASRHMTSIVTTHNLSLARELGERALLMDQTHRIIYDGPLDELLEDRELLLRANLLHRHRHRHGDFEHSHFHMHDWD
ncbi:energy-coupling factor ABC transporter ATP-binding protein [Hydrogenimonas sp.]